MNKMFYLAVLVMSAFGTMVFASCGSDHSNGNEYGSEWTVNSGNGYSNNQGKSIAGMVINKDASGKVVSIKGRGEGENVTFEYKNAGTRSASTPDVVMTVVSRGERTVFNLFLNEQGYVSHCDETEYSKGEYPEHGKWDFTYNNDGQLLTVFRSEDGNEKTTIVYEGGNIVETTEVSEHEPYDKNIHKIFYTSQKVANPILNKGGIMMFDETLGVDLDEMKYAYYAGMLGNPTKHLPVRSVEEDGEQNVFTWKLNKSGYPTSLRTDGDFYRFVW